MSRSDWFRRTTWASEDEAEFRARLQRSRTPFQKAQYLRIQALHLQETGSEPLLRAACDLLDEMIRDFPESIQLSIAHHQRAQCLLSLCEESAAVDAFREAFGARRRLPNVQTSAHLDFALFAVRHRRTDLYAEAWAVLDEFASGEPFPANQFKLAGARAMIAHWRGERGLARRYAVDALNAAAAPESPFPRHRALGLVHNPDTKLLADLHEIAAADDAVADDRPGPRRFRWFRSIRLPF